MDTNTGNAQAIRLLKTTQSMFLINGSVWLALGILSFIRAFTGSGNLRFILSALMVTNAAVMLWLGFMIVRAQPRIFFLAILYVAVNVALSITDQFGWIDSLILLLNLILLGLLFITRQKLNQIKA